MPWEPQPGNPQTESHSPQLCCWHLEFPRPLLPAEFSGYLAFAFEALMCLTHRNKTLIPNLTAMGDSSLVLDTYNWLRTRPLHPEGHTQHTPNSVCLLSLHASPPHASTMPPCRLLPLYEQVSAKSQACHAHWPEPETWASCLNSSSLLVTRISVSDDLTPLQPVHGSA